MANSKSNIYPIQLQGAELCLNRYDAEIKQYSGFNKNNSPFVGGCLSNVFTKEETVEGGNDDNVYIDTNGDVYRVDDEGLYRNEEKIIDYSASDLRPNGIYFFKKRKLNISNVVKAISETIYITVEPQVRVPGDNGMWQNSNSYVYTTGYFVHWGDGHKAYICDVINNGLMILDIAYKDGRIAFTAKKDFYNGGEQMSTLNYMIYVPDENNSYYKEYSNRTYYGRDVRDPFFTANICKLKKAEVPQVVCFKENGFMWAFNMPWFSRVCYIDYETEEVTSSMSFTSTSDKIISSDFNSWFMTKDGEIHFYWLGYQNNDHPEQHVNTPAYKEYSYTLSGYQRFVQVMELSYENGAFTAAPIWYNKSLFHIATDGNVTFQGSPQEGTVGCVVGFFKSYGCQYYSKIREKNSSTKGLYLSFCQDANNFAINVTNNGNDCTLPGGGQFFLEPFKILINNNELSNLSIYCMSYAYVRGRQMWVRQGNTVEDWNTIKDIEFIDTDKCVYRTYADEWFVIEKTVPKISLKYNQVVVNCNYEMNSFDLTYKKVTHFAPDWNGCYVKDFSSYQNYFNAYYNFTEFSTPVKIASAINEYNLKNNPSLLTNEILITPFIGQISTDYLIGDLKLFQSFVYICLLKDNAINIYCSKIDGVITDTDLYQFSGSIFNMFDKELEGLPYPNNTDGNVQYSPNIFSEFIFNFGTDVFVKNNRNVYQLMKEGQDNVMSFFLGTLVEDLEYVFIIQGQYYGVINNKIFSLQFLNGVIADSSFIVNIQGLQFVGNTPYEALFFSKTNRCLYSFTGANILQQKQLVDKISEVRDYLYNPATQTVFLVTDIGIIFYGLLGMFLIEYANISNVQLTDGGIILSFNNGNYRYVKYYLDEEDEGYTKENINVETSFYGMNNEVVTINDCLYFRIFSEEHEEGDLKVSATTISLSGRKTEETTFKIKASDWDKITHTIYLRYQPKTQRGLGVAFAIDSPFKIASLSVGSQPDAVLVDKVSKGAITAPSVTTNNNEW